MSWFEIIGNEKARQRRAAEEAKTQAEKERFWEDIAVRRDDLVRQFIGARIEGEIWSNRHSVAPYVVQLDDVEVFNAVGPEDKPHYITRFYSRQLAANVDYAIKTKDSKFFSDWLKIELAK